MHKAPSELRTGAGSTILTEADWLFLDTVERYLARGLALKRWWECADAADSYEQRFTLERNFHRASNSYGFFGQAAVGGSSLPVMGNVQDTFYDRPKVPSNQAGEATEWIKGQIREFVLHYFMRVSSFRQPEVFSESPRLASSPSPTWLSWCPRPRIARQGFGFSQIYYKLADSGATGKFSPDDEFAIVDLRELGRRYEWIVAKVRIFDFNFKLRPFGDGPELVLGLDEESYLVLSPHFILDEERPAPGILGTYGLGYAFIKSPSQGVLAWGPGQFEAAVELIQFRVMDDGEIYVHMVFVVDRPNKISSVTVDPIDWSFRIADLLTLGMTSKAIAAVKSTLNRFSLSLGEFDPVYSSIALVNALSAGQAAERLCISREQLDRVFLQQHFLQHYQAIIGSLFTWRQIGNWLEPESLPDWVVSGRSS